MFLLQVGTSLIYLPRDNTLHFKGLLYSYFRKGCRPVLPIGINQKLEKYV